MSSSGVPTHPPDRPAAADHNDWDHHWDAYGEAAEGNPANVYRRRLLLKLLGTPNDDDRVLDIGSGQGEFALHLQKLHPRLDIRGVEYSAAGVQRSRELAAAQGLPTRFSQVDLLHPTELEPGEQLATLAVCSEVLEHVEDPVTLLHNSRSLLAPGAKVVITVPGGPRSAFDHHIGHFQHFTSSSLSATAIAAGYHVERVLRAGFPTFNVYKMAVIARGKRLITDVTNRDPHAPSSRAEIAVRKVFDAGFRIARDDFPGGWQMAAVVRTPRRGDPAA